MTLEQAGVVARDAALAAVRRLGLVRGSRGYHIRRLIRSSVNDLTIQGASS